MRHRLRRERQKKRKTVDQKANQAALVKEEEQKHKRNSVASHKERKTHREVV